MLINDHPKLDAARPFKEIFYDSLKQVKVKVHGDYIDKYEFDEECVKVISIYDEEPLIDYVTDEFWKDKAGNFIKPIYKYGLVI